MPSKSPSQRRLMAAAAHDAGFARKAGVPQSVAREFNQADSAKRPKKKTLTSMVKAAKRRRKGIKTP